MGDLREVVYAELAKAKLARNSGSELKPFLLAFKDGDVQLLRMSQQTREEMSASVWKAERLLEAMRPQRAVLIADMWTVLMRVPKENIAQFVKQYSKSYRFGSVEQMPERVRILYVHGADLLGEFSVSLPYEEVGGSLQFKEQVELVDDDVTPVPFLSEYFKMRRAKGEWT